MPDCRSAPPKRNLPSQARSIVSAGPARTAPNGQPSPFEKQIVTVSASSPQADGSMPAATEALKRRAPSRWTRGAARARGLDGCAELLERPDAAAGAAMCVLEHEHAARAELVDLLDLLRRRPPGLGDEALHDEAGVDRGASPLVDEDVRPLLGDDLAAGPGEHAQRRLVRHRRRRQEERRLVAEQLGHPALQLVRGRILALLLVADLGGRHRSEHPRRRLRDGVGAQVDHDGRTLP